MNTKKYQSFYTTYKKKLKEQYPSSTEGLIPPVSPFLIPVSHTVVSKINYIIKLLYKISHLKNYAQHIQTNKRFYLEVPVSSSALLMSYDFHISPAGELKLIEVNTHSSGYLVSELVDQTQGITNHSLSLLKKSFEEEWQRFSKQACPPSEILIGDHHIKSQKMYIEFLMYKDLLNYWGWPCCLHEIESLNINSKRELVDLQEKPVQMLYNRSTDFYFEGLPYLKQAFMDQKCCISPHPKEYLLLADKERLCEWSSEDFLNRLNISSAEKTQIKNIVPFTALVRSVPEKELWEKRKTLFFKPLRGYGGKSVYRGKNISRKVFNRIVKEPGVFQEIVPPPVFTDPLGEEWKYDIRAYVYKDQVQKLSSRVYKGQLMGFKEPLSGFASVVVQ